MVLQESDNGILSGWGWADQGWNGAGGHIYFTTSGQPTLQIQQREDWSPSIRSYCRRTRS